MELSVTTDMFDYTYKPRMEQKLRLFKDSGFDHVHWCDDWDSDRLYTREDMNLYKWLLDDLGVNCLDVHGAATADVRIDSSDSTRRAAYVKLLKNRVEFCGRVGGDAVAVHPPTYHEPDLERRLKRADEAVEELKPLCRVLGVTLALENCYPDDHHVIKRLFDSHPECLTFCLDTGHANIHGNLDRLETFTGRLTVTHIHDNRGDEDSHMPPGWGTVDWGRVNDMLRGAEKPLNLEVTHNQDYFKGSMQEFIEETRRAAFEHLKTG
ncbi:sugar phosphate isomerase/epimerase [Candidatus Bathyarchaeota archaeon]|nr:sugar phosphate isomerase/epimerase [Candidatus Bathyarchaeota archaeon]